MTEVLPLLYLHGMSTGDFVPALEEFFGSAAGLSSPVITPLTKQWQGERTAFANRDLSGVDYVYVWADWVHFKVRLEEANLCALVNVGVRADGTKELVAIVDGLRESTESWADLLRDLKRRGMRAPVLAVGDGALGFWGALAQVFPETRHQRDWVHKVANVLNALPKSAHPSARRMLADIRDAEDRDHALVAIDAFAAEFAVRWAQGGGQDRRRRRRSPRLLRLPRRALDPPQDLESHRVHVLHRAPADAGDQGSGLPGRRVSDGLQAHRVRPTAVAGSQRAAPRRPRPRRREV